MVRPTWFLGVAAAVAFVTACAADPNPTAGVDPLDDSIETLPPATSPAGEPADSADPSPLSAGPAPTDEPRADPDDTVADELAAPPVTAFAFDDASSERLATVAIRAQPITTAQTAVDLAVRPGDTALFLVEHAGRVLRVEDGTSVAVADVRDRLAGHRNEQGLTGLEFSDDGRFAWLHSTTPEGATTIEEVPVEADGTFDLSRSRVIIDVGGPPGINHNSGDMLRAPDGTLFITLGDGDAGTLDDEGKRRPASDPYRVAHDPSRLRGSILRIRPTPGVGSGYEIPEDNPFANGPLRSDDGRLVDGRPEVWAWGLRNPWKISFDPTSETLWVTDVGGDEAEEINLVDSDGDHLPGRGVDFGWSRFEGTLDRNLDVEPALAAPISPFFAYPHDGLACAISGGEVYRGDAIPELRGGYVFADFCEGSVRLLDPATRSARRLIGTADGGGIAGVSGVRVGPDGELYVLSWFGEVFRIVSA